MKFTETSKVKEKDHKHAQGLFTSKICPIIHVYIGTPIKKYSNIYCDAPIGFNRLSIIYF